MILLPTPDRGPSLLLIEGGLTLIAFAIGLSWPSFGVTWFARIERSFARLARHRSWAVWSVGVLCLVMRLALLPVSPIPRPFILDGFSFLLASDTFASGRLTNPTPPMWQHFETFQVTMHPTYMSMYFPAHGMILAAGQALTGQPWYGLLCVTALLCAAICWMLQAWLPPTWALLGGLIAVLRLGLFSYWINTYSGGAAIAALGGALVLGALPRFMRSARALHAFVLTAGLLILANSRPYEGLLLTTPVLLYLGRWLFRQENTPPAAVMLRRLVPSLLLIVCTFCWMAYYNHRVFGNAFTEPYSVDRTTYAIAPHFVWQAPHHPPAYRHKVMRDFYAGWELDQYKKLHSVHGFVRETVWKFLRAVLFFAGLSLLPVAFALPWALADRRMRFLWICVLFLTAGMLFETWLIPHYLAPFTAAFYALGLQCARHLRAWRSSGKRVGVAVVRFLVTACILLVCLRIAAKPLHLRLGSWPTTCWFGAEGFGDARAHVQAALEQHPGAQLAIVRYSTNHDPVDEWVYNAADIDRSKVIWAREMGGGQDRELLDYYKDRTVWLVQPDQNPAIVSRYTDATTPLVEPLKNQTR